MEITEETLPLATPLVMEILHNWKLNSDQIWHILGLEGTAPKRDFRRFRDNLKSLPYSEKIAIRIEHIIGINAAMRTSYPFNAEICASWLRQPHRRFAKATPLEVIMKQDIDGLTRIRVELDCAYGWAMSEDAHKAKNG